MKPICIRKGSLCSVITMNAVRLSKHNFRKYKHTHTHTHTHTLTVFTATVSPFQTPAGSSKGHFSLF